MSYRCFSGCSIAALTVATGLMVSPGLATPTKVAYLDVSTCDPLFIPQVVDELGSPIVPFPGDELIDHQDLGPSPVAVCPTDDPLVPDALVKIVNLTNRTFTQVWYIADRETTISNVDGFAEDDAIANSGVPISNYAFRIDNAISDPNGIHHPLLFESNPNGLFDPGETWEFVLQDYSNLLNYPPDAFVSFGVGSASIDIPGALGSSGSIVAIPEPQAGSLLGLAMACAGAVRRRLSRTL